MDTDKEILRRCVACIATAGFFFLLSKDRFLSFSKGQCVTMDQWNKFGSERKVDSEGLCEIQDHLERTKWIYNDPTILIDRKTMNVSDLIRNIDKNEAPGQGIRDKIATHVFLQLNATNFNVVEYPKAVLQLYARLHLEWNETRLLWDFERHRKTGKPVLVMPDNPFLKFKTNEIWWPKVNEELIDREASGSVDEPDYIRVYRGNRVKMGINVKLNFTCDQPNLFSWPIYSYTCKFMWNLDAWKGDPKGKVDFWDPLPNRLPKSTDSSQIMDFLSVEQLTENPSWILANWNVTRSRIGCRICHEPFLHYKFTVQKFPPFLFVAAIIPLLAILSSVLVLLFLLNPRYCNEWRISVGLVDTFLIGIVLITFNSFLPSSGNGVPALFGLYYLTLTAVLPSLIMSVLCLMVSQSKYPSLHFRFPPIFNPVITNQVLMKIICLEDLHDEFDQPPGESHEMEIQDGNLYNPEAPIETENYYMWIALTSVVDRFIFISYCIGFCFLTIVYIVFSIDEALQGGNSS